MTIPSLSVRTFGISSRSERFSPMISDHRRFHNVSTRRREVGISGDADLRLDVFEEQSAPCQVGAIFVAVVLNIWE